MRYNRPSVARVIALRLASFLALAATVACVLRPIELANRGCPCPAEYVCDEATQLCVGLDAPDATAPVDLGAADATDDPCGPPRAIVPDAIQARCTAGMAPRIDGILGEWGSAAFAPFTVSTAEKVRGVFTGVPEEDDANSSAQIAFRWDAEYLYAAVKIVDDLRVIETGRPYHENDAFELFLDGDGAKTELYASDDHQFLVQADGPWQEYRNRMQITPASTGVVVAVGLGELGAASWVLEMAVPWSALGNTGPALGRVMGVDAVLADRDAVGGGVTNSLTWFTEAGPSCPECPGSGCLPACSTRIFSTLQLGGR